MYDLKKKLMGTADHLFQKSVDLFAIREDEMGVAVEKMLPYMNELITQVVLPAEAEYLEMLHGKNAIDLKECMILLDKVLDAGVETIRNRKLRYLFVDEFQDTDDVQIKVFQKLQKQISVDCRLFVVGDLKQSIYRFRGARLSAFEQLQISPKFGWEIFHLQVNYRTDARLLDLYDGIFRRMEEDGYLPYVPEEDQLSSDVCFPVEEDRLFQCISYHGRDTDAFFDRLFHCVEDQRAWIKRWMEEALQGREIGKEERTIAILVRNNWQVAEIVSEAKKHGISIQIQAGGDLFRLPSTQDLYKLVLAIEHAEDPLYLVNFIESGYTDLNLDYMKIHGMSEEEKLESFQEILDAFFQLRMKKKWREVLEEAYTQPALYVLKKIFDALQPWRNACRDSAGQDFYRINLEALLERIVMSSKSDLITLHQISDYLKINIMTGQKEPSRVVEEGDSMEVPIICTTVHRSKGLEYGTVILPYTSEDISDIRKVKLEADYSQSKLSYTVSFENQVRERNSHYDERMERDSQISEEVRILYVALTRAIRNCIWMLDQDRQPAISWGTVLGNQYEGGRKCQG